MKQIFLSVLIFNSATVFPVHKTAFNEQYFLWSRLWSLRSRNLIDDNASIFYGHFDASASPKHCCECNSHDLSGAARDSVVKCGR